MTQVDAAPVEWPAGLDLAAMAALGWHPIPFRQYVLKLHGRCDLACDYCYMYTLADQSWRAKPAMMSRAVVDRVCSRIADHATTHGLGSLQVVLHGGEPLLAGADTIGYVAAALRRRLPAATRLDLRIQTNAVRLDEPVLRTLAEQRIRVGVSLDGDREAHDRHRRRANGMGSFTQVRAGLRLLTRHHPELFAGLLCTIELRNDPVTTYQALLEYAPPLVDLLLPHGNWSTPPPGRRPGDPATPYADWLAAVFDRWYAPACRETEVRIFQEIAHLLLGGASRTEAVGLSPVATVVVDTDGALEQVDTLRSAYPGAIGTGMNVHSDSFDAAMTHPGVVARQIGLAALADTCRRCPVHRVCGGGYYPHRYRRGAGFQQPSVYCPDLLRLITHIDRRISADLAALVGSAC